MTTVPQANYIQWNNATLSDLQPRARLYRFEGMLGYVARVGNNDDYAVYQGSADWMLGTIADHGTKISEQEARGLFPICLEAGLSYRW